MTVTVLVALGTLLLWPALQLAAEPRPPELQISAKWAAGTATDGIQEALVEIEASNLPAGATITGTLPAGATITWADEGAVRSADEVTWPASGDHQVVRYRVAGGFVTAANPAVRATVDTVTTAPLSLRGLVGEPNLTKTLLPSGLTLLTLERPDTPTVALRLAVLAGARNEDDTTSGGSHWLEHAHFLGTMKYPAGMTDLDGAIERVGGQMNATTGSELTSYFNLVPADRFDLGLDVLSQQLLHSTFPEEAFNRERQVVFEELKRRDDSPSTFASDTFFTMVFQHSPLRRHPAGTIESVQSIPVSAMLAYRAQRYVTGNAAVAIAGNIRHAEALAKVKAVFAPMSVGERGHTPFGPEPRRTVPVLREAGSGTRQAEVRLGFPIAGLDSNDLYALTVLDEILDGAGRRLVTEIREKRGLASQVSSDLSLYSDAGFWLAAVSTTPANVEQVRMLTLAELQRLKDEPVAPEEVARTVRYLLGRRTLAEESNNSQAGRLASRELLGLPESSEEYEYRMRRVTPGDLQRVARTYFDTENYVFVVVRS